MMCVRCLPSMPSKCYLYLCVLLKQLEWIRKAIQITERPSKPDIIYIIVYPVLQLLLAAVSLPFFESESPGAHGPVPTYNNGRISTISGLAISCSFSGCERLREEGASASGEEEGAWKSVGYGTWDRTLGIWQGGLFLFEGK